ncbi:MAG: hypothetical protein QW078_02385 [Thermoplasmatales archaeon]
MVNINLIFYTDFAIFSVFVTLVITELMGSVLLLIAYDKYKAAVLSYVVPVWEVTGTFGAFWVVASDLAYPSILIPVALIFSFPILLFLILFVARNTTISFAEFITKKKWLDEKKLYKGYAIASILMSTVVLVVLSVIISGNGINLSNLTFSAYSWIVHIDNIIFIAGAILLVIGLAPIFYNDLSLKNASVIFLIIGVIVSTISFEMFKNWHLTPYVVIPDILAVLLYFLYYLPSTRKVVTNKAVFIALVSIATFLLNFMAYPTILGGAIKVDSITNTGPIAQSFFPITALGSIVLAVMIFLYATAVRRRGALPKEMPIANIDGENK